MDFMKWYIKQFNRGKSEPIHIKNIIPGVVEILEERKNANERIAKFGPVLAST